MCQAFGLFLVWFWVRLSLIRLTFGLGWLGLAWLGLAFGWLGLAWARLGWPGLAWVGLGWHGFWVDLGYFGLA